VELLLSLGATVVSGDIQNPPAEGDFLFVQTDVRKWADLTKLFKAAKDKHGRVDYVFANAGIGPRADYLNLAVGSDGELLPPCPDTVDINLNSVVNTVTLATHYLKAEGGSIVIMGSSTGLHPMRAVDYCKCLSICFINLPRTLTYMSSSYCKGRCNRFWPQFRAPCGGSGSSHPSQHPRTLMDGDTGVARSRESPERSLTELPISCRGCAYGCIPDGQQDQAWRSHLCLRGQVQGDREVDSCTSVRDHQGRFFKRR
jgi:hypothetical protein